MLLQVTPDLPHRHGTRVQRLNAVVETLKRPCALGYSPAWCSFSIPITCSSLNRLLRMSPSCLG